MATATAEQILVLFEFHNAFPVLQPGNQTQEYIPYNIIAPHEAQAMRNHGGQSLQRLAERGGLDWTEILAVLRDRTWKEMGYGLHCSKEEVEKAKNEVLAYVRERIAPCGCHAAETSDACTCKCTAASRGGEINNGNA